MSKNGVLRQLDEEASVGDYPVYIPLRNHSRAEMPIPVVCMIPHLSSQAWGFMPVTCMIDHVCRLSECSRSSPCMITYPQLARTTQEFSKCSEVC
jgi:hypothetical protein